MTPREAKGLNDLYIRFFNRRNCQYLTTILNDTSRIDFILSSGETSVIGEYKQRNCASYEYESCMIEKMKYDSLKEVSRLLGDAKIYYLVSYVDGITAIWELDPNISYPTEIINAPRSQSDRTPTPKKIYSLRFQDVALVISRKTWNAIPLENFLNYMTHKQLVLV